MRLEHWFYTAPLRLRSLFRRRRVEQELDEEIRYHIETQMEQYVAAGMSPEEARLAALRAMGSVELQKDRCRDTRRVNRIENVMNDLRYAARILGKAPGFTAVAVLTLALGIGANSAMFSVVNAILLRPLPFREPDRLVRIWESKPRNDYFRNVVNPFNFLDWRERSRSFEAMAAIMDGTVNLTAGGEPLAVPGLSVSTEFFQILGTAPVLGRVFVPEEGTPGRNHAIILSYGLWQTRFGGRPDIVGQRVAADGASCTVVGVMPQGFSIPKQKAEAWKPLPIVRSKDWEGGRYLSVIARLKPGVSLDEARQEIATVAQRSAGERPRFNTGWSAEVVPLLEDAVEKIRLPLLVLLSAVAFVLLIACANVANLLLMRGAGRTREIAVRTALGAARARVVQQLLLESLLLSLAGLATGLVLAKWLLKGLLALIPDSVPLPRAEPVTIDGGVFVFAFLASLVTAVLFGLAPALRLSRVELQDALKQGSLRSGVSGTRPLRRAFVVVEVALALLLSVGAGLMLRSFHRLTSVHPGFQPGKVLTMGAWFSPGRYLDDAKRSRYVEQILGEIRTIPGVRAAGSIHFLPLTGKKSGSCFARAEEGQATPASSSSAQFLVISPGYFPAVGTRILRGRDFGERDKFGAPSAAVVNEAFVRRYFSGEDPVGRRLNVCWSIPNPVEIAGVVADARQTDLAAEPAPTIFLPNTQAPMFFATFVMRAQDDPGQIARAAQAAVHRVNPDQPVSDVRTMEAVLSDSVSQPRFRLVLLVAFATMALLLAALGVYGVVSYSVTQRTQEIGIRIALGAANPDVARMVLYEALLLAGAGVAIGLAAALALTRVLRTLLFEVKPADPTTLATVAGVLLLIAALATLPPALRAVKVDPMEALRYE